LAKPWTGAARFLIASEGASDLREAPSFASSVWSVYKERINAPNAMVCSAHSQFLGRRGQRYGSERFQSWFIPERNALSIIHFCFGIALIVNRKIITEIIGLLNWSDIGNFEKLWMKTI
jgi:hypothetical protein